MPGSIQVSVLDFKELPSSSNFVKVSLGKVEHEAGEKGTFSFPLTNLRDNLIITIQDSDGNQLSHSGVRTMSIIEKGTWDDFFPIEGGGVIHMKLQFILSDEERNRIRSMRESAMKKKQSEILGTRIRKVDSAQSLASSLHRHEVSDVLRATSSQDLQSSSFNGGAVKGGLLTPLDDHTSVKAAESSDGIKKEAFLRQSFTNATDRREETSFIPTMEGTHQKAWVENSESPASLTDSTKKSEAATPKLSGDLDVKLDEQSLEEKIPNDIKITNEESTSTPLQETETGAPTDLAKKNHASESNPMDNKKLDKQNLEEKSPSNVMETSESKPFPFPQETKVNMIKNNEIKSLLADAPKRLQEISSQGAGSSRSTIAEKIKSFSPTLAGEADKRSQPEKTPRNIKKMISAFESSISQDRVPLKPLGTKHYRVGTVRFLKDGAVNDFYDKSESSQEVKNTEIAGSSRLRNSFSTGDLRKELASIISKGEQVGFANDFVESSEPNMQSKGNEPTGREKFAASTRESSVKGELHRRSDVIVKQGVDQVCLSGSSSPERADEEASKGSLGQAIKIALVVGFGVLVLLFRQRESGKGKKEEHNRSFKNQVFMGKRGSIEEQQRIKIGFRKLS